MMIRRILAAALVAVMVIACAAPAFAADESKTNMMLDATFLEAINITAYHTDEGSSFEGLVDGVIAPGPSFTQNSLNARINNRSLRYDADGKEKGDGEYIWIMTYELLNKAVLDSFTFYSVDTVPFGDPTTIPWLLHDFDILVSETGEDGSWKLAYRAENLHDGATKSDCYQFVKGHDGRIDYWTVSGDFDKAYDAKFVRIGVPTLTDEPYATIDWVSMSEMEIYGELAAESKTNMMKNASFVKALNITAYHTEDEGSGFEGLVDGIVAPGPSYTHHSLSAQINNVDLRYDADGNGDANGEYIWIMTYELLNKATLDSFTFYFVDTVPFGDPTTIPWLLHDFDILVSETGAEGSWKLAYRAEELHDGVIDSDYYQFVKGHDGRIDYWTLSGEFEKACDAKFVRIGVPTLTDEPFATIKWVSISEMEIYGKLAAGVTPVDNPPEIDNPAPVNAAGQTDVLYDASVVKSVNISGNVGGLVDGKIAPGPTHKDKSLNGQVDRNKRYDVNGSEKANGEYIWLVTFEMKETAEVDTIELDTIDLVAFGDESTVPWLIRDFDVYVSETGEDGSWKLVHHAANLHDGENSAPAYRVVQAGNDHMMYWAYTAKLAEPVTARFVTFAVPTLTNDWMSANNWVNITEFQLFSKAAPADEPEPGEAVGEAPYGGVIGIPALTPWDAPWSTEEATLFGTPWLPYYVDQTESIDYDAPYVDFLYPLFHP